MVSAEGDDNTAAGSPPTPARGRSTLRDVAILAGVSHKTASRVINGEPGVIEAKVTAVRQAVAKLGYRPNFTASSLRRAGGRIAAIAAVLEDVSNPFSSALHRALENVALARNVAIFAGSVDEDPQRERALIDAFTARQADALVVVPASGNQRYLADVVSAGTPIVFVDRPPVGIDVDAVVADNHAGAAGAVRHLISHGHRDIAYLGDLRTIATAQQRYQGYREAMADEGIRLQPDYVVHDLHTEADAREAAVRLLNGPKPPTALFTSQNLVTIGVVRALRDLAHQQHVALVGFDDFPLADLLQPAVTVVAQNPSEMGRIAASLLFRRLDGESWQPTMHFVPTTLIQRGSGEILGPHR